MASSGGNGPSTKTSTTQVKEGKADFGIASPPSGIELLSTVWRDKVLERRTVDKETCAGSAGPVGNGSADKCCVPKATRVPPRCQKNEVAQRDVELLR